MISSKAIRLFLAASALCAAANASTVFDFEGDAPGTATNFTDTVNGLSATFSSPADPGGFVVYSSIFQTLTGNVLGEPGPAGLGDLALTINFSQNLTGVSLNFATGDFVSASPLTITAYENTALVGSASDTGSFLTGSFFPEGVATFNGSAFNELVISSTATDFAVDNIAVTTATPEPALTALVGIGLLGIGIPAVRRKSASTAVTK